MHRLLRCGRSMASALICVETERDLVEALDTIDMLRSLVNVVMNFRPKATFIHGVNLCYSTWNQVCRFCDQPTELQGFIEGDASVVQADSSRRTLSTTLCCNHTSRRENGMNFSEYRRWLRNEACLQREIQELTWASARKGTRESSCESMMLYAFRKRIVDDNYMYLDSATELAREARALVKHGMTDRKKILVMLHCLGFNTARIAKELSISKQAVYKAMKSIPDAYMFASTLGRGPVGSSGTPKKISSVPSGRTG